MEMTVKTAPFSGMQSSWVFSRRGATPPATASRKVHRIPIISSQAASSSPVRSPLRGMTRPSRGRGRQAIRVDRHRPRAAGHGRVGHAGGQWRGRAPARSGAARLGRGRAV